mmetsp:Transcript_159752/g.512658  ORF Transcript_159752/g.512658 Transcript_159752/m.512658 type:complete len:469 (-) Transcript_159752:2190-3596(-)
MAPPGERPGLALLELRPLEVRDVDHVVLDVAVGEAVHQDGVGDLVVPVPWRGHPRADLLLEFQLGLCQALGTPSEALVHSHVEDLGLPSLLAGRRRHRGAVGRANRARLRGRLLVGDGGAAAEVRGDGVVEQQIVEEHAARRSPAGQDSSHLSLAATAAMAAHHGRRAVVLSVLLAAVDALGAAPVHVLLWPRETHALPAAVVGDGTAGRLCSATAADPKLCGKLCARGQRFVLGPEPALGHPAAAGLGAGHLWVDFEGLVPGVVIGHIVQQSAVRLCAVGLDPIIKGCEFSLRIAANGDLCAPREIVDQVHRSLGILSPIVPLATHVHGRVPAGEATLASFAPTIADDIAGASLRVVLHKNRNTRLRGPSRLGLITLPCGPLLTHVLNAEAVCASSIVTERNEVVADEIRLLVRCWVCDHCTLPGEPKGGAEAREQLLAVLGLDAFVDLHRVKAINHGTQWKADCDL